MNSIVPLNTAVVPDILSDCLGFSQRYASIADTKYKHSVQTVKINRAHSIVSAATDTSKDSFVISPISSAKNTDVIIQQVWASL